MRWRVQPSGVHWQRAVRCVYTDVLSVRSGYSRLRVSPCHAENGRGRIRLRLGLRWYKGVSVGNRRSRGIGRPLQSGPDGRLGWELVVSGVRALVCALVFICIFVHSVRKTCPQPCLYGQSAGALRSLADITVHTRRRARPRHATRRYNVRPHSLALRFHPFGRPALVLAISACIDGNHNGRPRSSAAHASRAYATGPTDRSIPRRHGSGCR